MTPPANPYDERVTDAEPTDVEPADPLLSPEGLQFVTDRHIATLSTMGTDGAIHVVAVGFSYRDGIARVITGGGTQKTVNIEADERATLSQYEGARWLTLQGRARIERDPASVALGVELYSQRYRAPRENPERVVIVIEVDKVLGSRGMKA